MKNTLLFLCALACIPSSVRAQVIINEIAWMGTSASANDEWIELYNSGSGTVSLLGWSLNAQDGDPSISLSGEITAGGYVLLERTDDESVPGISAGVIYTGGLGNTGETLGLFDDGGASVDSVASGENWSLGGDNTAKNTVQRQADNSWITGIPTPGAQNSTEHVPVGEVQGSSTSTPSSSVKKKTTATAYKQNVFAYAGPDIQTVAGAYAFFEGYSVNANNEHIHTDVPRWSFGDGGVGKGKDLSHIYSFPGTYTAVLSVESQHQHSHDSAVVYVTPANVSISSALYGERGYVEIYNQSDVPLDVSLWKLRADYTDSKKTKQLFIIPKTTTIAPHAHVPFPSVITGIDLTQADRVVLFYPNGKKAAVFEGLLYETGRKKTSGTKNK